MCISSLHMARPCSVAHCSCKLSLLWPRVSLPTYVLSSWQMLHKHVCTDTSMHTVSVLAVLRAEQTRLRLAALAGIE
jgi:hypothetical protein